MSLIYSEQVGGRKHGLYLGGKTDAKSREKLERWGVTHVLNVTPPKEGSIQGSTYITRRLAYPIITKSTFATNEYPFMMLVPPIYCNMQMK